jgi:hypothetical protein
VHLKKDYSLTEICCRRNHVHHEVRHLQWSLKLDFSQETQAGTTAMAGSNRCALGTREAMFPGTCFSFQVYGLLKCSRAQVLGNGSAVALYSLPTAIFFLNLIP